MGQKVPEKYFLKLLLSFLPSLDHKLPTCEQYFLLLNKLVARASPERNLGLDLISLIKQTHGMLRIHPIVEVRVLFVELMQTEEELKG